MFIQISREANQDLVRNAEQFGQLLAQTLSEEIPETIKSRSNVGMYVLTDYSFIAAPA